MENSPFPSPPCVLDDCAPSPSLPSTDRYRFETVGEQRLELEADSVPPALRFNACGPISLINKVNSALSVRCKRGARIYSIPFHARFRAYFFLSLLLSFFLSFFLFSLNLARQIDDDDGGGSTGGRAIPLEGFVEGEGEKRGKGEEGSKKGVKKEARACCEGGREGKGRKEKGGEMSSLDDRHVALQGGGHLHLHLQHPPPPYTVALILSFDDISLLFLYFRYRIESTLAPPSPVPPSLSPLPPRCFEAGAEID